MSDFGYILIFVSVLLMWSTYIKLKRNNKIRKKEFDALAETERIAVCPPDGLHEWEKWKVTKYTRIKISSLDKPIIVEYSMQDRYCKKCGYLQSRNITEK